MKKFLIKCSIFLLIGLLIGELVVRIFHLNTDVPKMYKSQSELIKFYPNQKGYWLKGSHKWVVNKYGQFGYEPKRLDNIFTVIGDSYISNIMNPPECHQANYLSKINKDFDFFPCSRDGASFMEMMEMKTELDSLNPNGHLLYVHHGDFVESIRDIKAKQNTTQVNLINGKKYFPELSSSKLKDLLYNFKFAYYIYRNYIVKSNNSVNNRDSLKSKDLDYDYLMKLILFVKKNYEIKNVYLIFSPDSDDKLIDLLKNNGFKVMKLQSSNYKEWKMEHDSHWSCHGHSEAAKQVSVFLKSLHLNKK